LKALEGDEEQKAKILELMEAVDSYIPEPERDIDKPFLMPIEDVFTITGRGTVVTGRIEQGKIESGNEVEIVGIHPAIEKTVVTGLEMFNKTLDYAQAGDNAGALLRGTKREEIERGQVLAKPGSITPHTVFKAEVYVLSKDEGGRHTPFFNGYRPQFYFRTTDVTGSIKLPEGQEMVMPTTRTWTSSSSSRSRWTRGSGSPSVRAGAPWAPASSPRSRRKGRSAACRSRKSASASRGTTTSSSTGRPSRSSTPLSAAARRSLVRCPCRRRKTSTA
jgi:hypothetical protein